MGRTDFEALRERARSRPDGGIRTPRPYAAKERKVELGLEQEPGKCCFCDDALDSKHKFACSDEMCRHEYKMAYEREYKRRMRERPKVRVSDHGRG